MNAVPAAPGGAYAYRAFTPGGQIEVGTVQAASPEQATDMIWSRGLIPIEPVSTTEQREVPWWKRDVGLGSKRPSARALSEFTRAFATFNQAGIPLDDALRLIAGQTASVPMRQICHSLLDSVLDGQPLSEALSQHGAIFQRDYVNMVRAGEAGSDTGRVFDELAALLERRRELAAKIKSALLYPSILLAMAFLSMDVIIAVLIPNVAPLFAQNGRDLPFLLRHIVAVQAHWTLAAFYLTGAFATLTGLIGILLKTPSTRLLLDRRLARLPLVGRILIDRNVARFSRTLGALLRSGVPLISAFDSARDVVRNRFLNARLGRARDGLRDGRGLAQSLSDHAALPERALQMIALGEDSGRLHDMLTRLAESLEKQSERQIDDMMTLLTPALTLIIAGLIGSFIFTVMSAILSINELAVQ